MSVVYGTTTYVASAAIRNFWIGSSLSNRIKSGRPIRISKLRRSLHSRLPNSEHSWTGLTFRRHHRIVQQRFEGFHHKCAKATSLCETAHVDWLVRVTLFLMTRATVSTVPATVSTVSSAPGTGCPYRSYDGTKRAILTLELPVKIAVSTAVMWTLHC